MMSDYFSTVRSELAAAVEQRAHLPWWRRVRLAHGRTLAVVFAALVIASPGVAAVSGLFSQGQPNPTGPVSAGVMNGIVRAGDSRLLPIKVADLQGGPPWGLRVVSTTRGETCVQVGRVQDGQLGSLGIADAWNNDHKFHAISPSATARQACGATDAVGHGFGTSGILGASDSASGSAYWLATPPALSGPAASGCKLAGDRGGAPASWPTCPAGSNRIIFYGLLGPDAVSVTYRTPSGGLATERTVRGVGAYLLVFPYNRTTCAEYTRGSSVYRGCFGYIGSTTPGPMMPGAIAEVRYTHGRSCELSGRAQPCPAVGWVLFKVKHVSREQVATAVHVRVFPAGSYGCPNKLGIGCQGIQFESPSRQVPIEWTFAARVAVTNSRTSYGWNLQVPNGCGPVGKTFPPTFATSFGTDSNIRAGQTLRYSTFLPPSCHGTYRLTVQFNAQTTDEPNDALGGGSGGPWNPIPIGKASFTIR
jgi:hypothetical protein